MDYFIIISLLIVSYLLGSIPSGYLLVKYVKKTDIRTQGSSNTGATNTTRILGLKFGLLALIFDAIKGIIIISILVIFKLENLYIVNNINILPFYGVMAVIGHVYSIFLNFKGGKAVATSFGILIILAPYLAIGVSIMFILIVLITRYISLASLVSSFIVIVTAIFLAIYKVSFPITPNLYFIPISYAIAFSILEIMIIYRHRENIKRLINKNENKFSLRIKKD